MEDEEYIGDIYCQEIGTFCNGLFGCTGCHYYILYEQDQISMR